ncbi:MAG: type II toxin-antitoxin system VapC family toxin [Acidobacteria bacterium]|nr:type II toxin-antitoxin system VapC family toxin [Acidobacteriota bacterium]
MVAVKPNPNVLSWFQSQNEEMLFLSIITIGEIEKRIYQLPASKKRTLLETWLFDDLAPNFHGRILEINRKLITAWAKMIADLKMKGVVRPSFDSLIEATALHHQLILVTRNVKNFQYSSVTILNPWEKLV